MKSVISIIRKRFPIFIFLLIATVFITPHKVFAVNVVINELLPHPSGGNDWAEIYNPTTNPVDLGSWTLEDSASTMKSLSGILQPQGFLSFDVSNRLNNSGDTILLKDSGGNTIDTYSYSQDPGIDTSIGRSPDGGGWAILTVPTKNAPNEPPPTPTPTQTITPSPTPTPPITQTPFPTPTPLFTIYNIPGTINSNEQFLAGIILSLPEQPNTIFYLKGAFAKAGSTNYFGLTMVNTSWVKNSSSFSSQYQITTDNNGDWSGKLEVMPDTADSGFSGTDDYVFKAGRYEQLGGSVQWSNSVNIKINLITGGSTESNPTQTPSISPTRIQAITTKLLPVSQALKPTSQITKNLVPDLSKESSVEGIATGSALIKNEGVSPNKLNLLLVVSGVIIFLISSFVVVIIFKKR